jgi:hypothetical protein
MVLIDDLGGTVKAPTSHTSHHASVARDPGFERSTLERKD